MKSGMKRIEAVNDFVIKFANVNGSGSASANTLFAKSIMRMGVPVSPRNIFHHIPHHPHNGVAVLILLRKTGTAANMPDFARGRYNAVIQRIVFAFGKAMLANIAGALNISRMHQRFPRLWRQCALMRSNAKHITEALVPIGQSFRDIKFPNTNF